MTNLHKDPLFVLVKSLSKSEKRQFKLYVGRLGVNTDAKFLALFNLLDRAKQYEEAVILENGIVKKTQLSNLKAHLYKQILVSLRLNPVNQNIRVQLREQLDFATILYQKGLYKQSLKILEKAKTLAIEQQEKNMASKLSNLSLELYAMMLKVGYARSDEDLSKITSYFRENLPEHQIDQLGFREKLWLYKAHLWYSFLTQDFLSSYKFASKWVQLFTEQKDMIQLHPVFYIKGNNYLLESLFYVKYSSQFKETLDHMEAVLQSDFFPKNDNISALSFLYLNSNKLNLHFLEGTFKQGLYLVQAINYGIDKHQDRLDQHHIMLLYYKIACLYFGVGDHKNCIVYLKKIIQNKHLKMREDLMCFARVLSLVAHYESGMDYHLEIQLKSTYKFLLKMNDLHAVQKEMIVFLRNLGQIYPSDLQDAFKKLHTKLKVYEDHPYEKRAFLYLDILSWLESHLSGRPVADIMREKALLKIR